VGRLLALRTTAKSSGDSDTAERLARHLQLAICGRVSEKIVILARKIKAVSIFLLSAAGWMLRSVG